MNTDPVVSPVKTRNPLGDKRDDVKEASKRPPTERAKPVSRPSKDVVDEGKFKKNEKHAEAPVPTVEVAPKTPAPEEADLFSPTDTLPSTAKPEFPRDTPPPPDLHSAADTGRPSRRPRGAVSYAEPNLRDKMRRPGKELVDAVGANARASRGTSIAAESVERDLPTGEKRTATKIKVEPDQSPAGEAGSNRPHHQAASPPPSPLADKRPPTGAGSSDVAVAASDSQLPSTVLTDRRRRSSSVSSGTLAALLAGSAQRISRAREAAEAARTGGAEVERPDSAGPGGEKGSVPEDFAQEEPRMTRRHSSMMDLRIGTGHEDGGKMGAGPRTGSGRRATLTGSSRGGGRKERPSVLGRQEGEPTEGGKPVEMSDEAQGGNVEGEDEKVGTTRRLERAASRRRSMML